MDRVQGKVKGCDEMSTKFASISGLSDQNDQPIKMVSLTGDINNPGSYEIPNGTLLNEIINKFGNGTKSGKEIKFVQVGGDTGAVFSNEELDTPFEYSTLTGHDGTMLETAKVEVFNEDTCMVNWSSQKMLENSKETCGKCVFCREGIFQLYRIMKDATVGKGRDGDIDLAIELSQMVKAGSLCDFGITSCDPLYTAINKFRDEFEKHIERKICDTLECISYANYYIDPNICNGCGDCLICPQHAIKGGDNLIHIIDENSCDKCGECEEVCPTKAVKRHGRVKPKLPLEPIAIGGFTEDSLGQKKGLGIGRRRRSSLASN